VDRANPTRHRLLFDALHVFVLCGFAIAQPIYDLVGQNAEFFVAHRMGPREILAFVGMLSVGLPASLMLVEFIASRFGSRTRRIVHNSIVSVLAIAFLAPLLKKVPDLSGLVVISAAAIGGILFTAAYVRLAGMRSFLTALSPSIVAFPLILLTLTPVSGLVYPGVSVLRPHASTGSGPGPIPNPVPIVFIIFDEFEAGALLDAQRNVDPVRFPNFAAFAAQSWWFPQAMTVWTETQRAVPAILTGLRPRRVDALPNLQDHPNNLFTWLRGTYGFNVVEPLTSLCPQDVCRTQQGGGKAGFRPDVFLSDLTVVYLHVLLPDRLARSFLPRMDASWKGFATSDTEARNEVKSTKQKSFTAQVQSAVAGDRHAQFSSFIESIKAEESNTLHFLHILLPHTPYTYLPSGSAYPSAGNIGQVEKIWTLDDHLPKLNYQQYLLQLGAVDTLIGSLMQRMKAVGLYDTALIVITSDHGKAFRPGKPTRSLASVVRDNAAELLQVPLFIKLPGQTEGRRSDRRVLTIDILPTIAEVLGTNLPWKPDGVSLIDQSIPERKSIELSGLDITKQTRFLDAAELSSYPHLTWKLETFGERTPLDRIAIADRHSMLIGKPVAEFGDVEEAAGLELLPEQPEAYEEVQPASGVVPALFQGKIVADQPAEAHLPIAIAVNGVIQVTTRSTEWAGAPYYLAAMLPEQAFKPGRNQVEVFKIDGQGERRKLLRIPFRSQETFRIERNPAGQEVLVSRSGVPIPVRAAAVDGYLDSVQSGGRDYTFQGWAVDRRHLLPAEKVLIFIDGKQVASGRPNRARPDLVKHFGASAVLEAGFALNVRKSALSDKPQSVRVMVLSDNAASEVNTNAAWKSVSEGME
jgi:hypothetical protein